jgi:hypothetical protein
MLGIATSGYSVVKEPEVRKAKIEIAKRLLSKRVPLPDEKILVAIGDPFDVSKEVIEVVEEVVEEKVSAHELIPLLAKNVNPTGIFTIGGEYYLMFKEDKVKSGGTISVEYKNAEYNLEIVRVLRNAYSLRLEDAEIEIKLK